MIGAAELREFWTAMASHLWLAGLVILALAAIERLLLRDAPARYPSLLWTASLAVLCVPASWIADWLQRALSGWMREPATLEVIDSGGALHAVLRPALLGQGGGTEGAGWPWLGLTLLWLVGASALALWIRWRGRAASVTVTTAEPVMGKRIAVAAARASIDPSRVEVIRESCVPHARGLLRPRVVVSEKLIRELDVDEIAAILTHETAHLERRDPARRLLYRAVLLIFWFFPLTWLVVRRLERAAESACDEAVLRAGFAPAVYSRAIAHTIRLEMGWMPAPGSALLRAPGTEIRRRLEVIRRADKETSMSRITTAGALAIAVLTTAVAVAAPQQGGVIRAKEQPQESTLTRLDRADSFDHLLSLQGVGRTLELEAADSLRDLLLTLARRGGFRIDLSDLPPAADGSDQVEIETHDATVGEVLVYLARNFGLEYTVAGRDELYVRKAPAVAGVLKRAPAPREIREVRPDGPLPVGGAIQAPERIEYVAPEYPEQAREARLGGVVILELTIDENGNVANADLLRGLGMGLDEAALDAARQWRYAPTLYNGEPVEVRLTATVQYSFADPRDGEADVEEAGSAEEPRPAQRRYLPAKAVAHVDPAYPEWAQEAGIEGDVWIEAVITQNGEVAAPRILRSLEPELDRLAIDAVRKWRFEPGTENGVAVPLDAVLTVSYRLEG